jgi:hypothetical protein
MQTKTITVTEAIKELSILDDRIKKASLRPMVMVERADGQVLYPEGTSITKEDILSNAQSYFDLLTYRDALRTAILNSNNSSKLSGFDMTVAAAIDMKNRIATLRSYANSINQQVLMAHRVANKADDFKNAQITQSIASIQNQDSSSYIEAINKAKTEIEARYATTLNVPVEIQEHYNTRNDSLDNFEHNIDVALNLHNAQTELTVNW